MKPLSVACEKKITAISHTIFLLVTDCKHSRWAKCGRKVSYIIRNGIRIRITYSHKYSIMISLHIHNEPFDRIPNLSCILVIFATVWGQITDILLNENATFFLLGFRSHLQQRLLRAILISEISQITFHFQREIRFHVVKSFSIAPLHYQKSY